MLCRFIPSAKFCRVCEVGKQNGLTIFQIRQNHIEFIGVYLKHYWLNSEQHRCASWPWSAMVVMPLNRLCPKELLFKRRYSFTQRQQFYINCIHCFRTHVWRTSVRKCQTRGTTLNPTEEICLRTQSSKLLRKRSITNTFINRRHFSLLPYSLLWDTNISYFWTQ